MERFLDMLPPDVRGFLHPENVRPKLVPLLSKILIAVVAFCLCWYVAIPFFVKIFIPFMTGILVFSQNVVTGIWCMLLSLLLMPAADFLNGTTRRKNYEYVCILPVTCLLVFIEFKWTAVLVLLISHGFKKTVDYKNERSRRHDWYEDVLIPAATCLLVCNANLYEATRVLLGVILFKKAVDGPNVSHKKHRKYPRSDEIYEIYEFKKYARDPNGRITYDVVGYHVVSGKYCKQNDVRYTNRLAIKG